MTIVKTLADGTVVRFFGWVDENGLPYGPLNPIPISGGDTPINAVAPATIGTVAANILSADPTRSVVLIQNVSQTAFIACRSGAAAGLFTAGSYSAGPQGYIVFEGDAAAAAISAISDTAATPASVGTG